MNEQDLMSRLAMSKAIMDKSENFKKPNTQDFGRINEDYEIDMPKAKYNIPQEFLQQSNVSESYIPKSNPVRAVGTPTVDAIKNSKLPDEIKRLMIEHPIVQPNMSTDPVLSNELVERATRLMGTGNQGKTPEKPRQTKKDITESSEGIDYNKIQRMIESAVKKTLQENGLLVESTEKSNESFQFKVGKHLFEGKVTKIKKLS